MHPVLLGASGPVRGRTFALEPGDTTIGRATANAVCIPDRSVSREHCIVRTTAAGIEIEDLESYNGTFVNGLRIRSRTLDDGDNIVIGEIQFTFRGAVAARAACPFPLAPRRTRNA